MYVKYSVHLFTYAMHVETSVVLFLLFVERTVYMQNWEQLVQ